MEDEDLDTGVIHSGSEEATHTALTPPQLEAEELPTQRLVAHLLVRSGHDKGRIYRLPDVSTVIGRADDLPIQIFDPGISRRHARITRNSDNTYTICDVGSRNGTFVNGDGVATDTVRDLRDGDSIELGVITVFTFRYAEVFEMSVAERSYETSFRDSATGLLNHRYIEQRLRSEIAYARRHAIPIALLLLAVDHFHQVTQRFGAVAGNALLRKVADRITALKRAEDVLARYRDNCFALICRATDIDQAQRCASRIQCSITSTAIEGTSEQVMLGIRVGFCAVVPPLNEGVSVHGLLEQARKHLAAQEHVVQTEALAEDV